MLGIKSEHASLVAFERQHNQIAGNSPNVKHPLACGNAAQEPGQLPVNNG